jgi:hypothetical protein
VKGPDYAVFLLAVVVEMLGGGILDGFGWWFFELGVGRLHTRRCRKRDIVRFFRKVGRFLETISGMNKWTSTIKPQIETTQLTSNP